MSSVFVLWNLLPKMRVLRLSKVLEIFAWMHCNTVFNQTREREREEGGGGGRENKNEESNHHGSENRKFKRELLAKKLVARKQRMPRACRACAEETRFATMPPAGSYIRVCLVCWCLTHCVHVCVCVCLVNCALTTCLVKASFRKASLKIDRRIHAEESRGQ